jgi:hypothetical protein
MAWSAKTRLPESEWVGGWFGESYCRIRTKNTGGIKKLWLLFKPESLTAGAGGTRQASDRDIAAAYDVMLRRRANSCKVPVPFNRVPCHEGVLEEWRYSSTNFLTSALDGGEWSASRPGRFTHWTGGWVGPRACLDAVSKRKIPSPRRGSNPDQSIVQPVVKLLW